MGDIIRFPTERRRAQIAQEGQRAAVRWAGVPELGGLGVDLAIMEWFGPDGIVRRPVVYDRPADEPVEYVQGPYWFGVRVRPEPA